MSSVFCPCLLVMVQDNNWFRFGQNNIVIKYTARAPVYGHQPVHWSNSGASSYSDDRPTCGVWRVHTMCADVT